MTARESYFKKTINNYVLNVADKKIPYGIGCAWLGRAETDSDSIKKQAIVLATAYQAGFRYYDTSAAYGESERVVGEFVNQVPRESIFLATKVRVREDVSPREAAMAVKRSLEQSQERLKTEYLDLFQIHDTNSLTNVLEDNGVLELLLEARKNGLICNIGLATRQHDLLSAAVENGQFDTILTYSDYTPIDRSATEVIKAADSRGVGVINASPLLFGLLTGINPQELPIPMDNRAQIRRHELAVKLYELCDRNGISLLDLALQFPIRQPAIDITLTGPAKPEEVMKTIAALNREIPAAFWEEADRWYKREQASSA